MDQPVPSSELNLENVGKDETSQSIVVEETAGCHCKPKEEEPPEPVVQPEEVKEDCEPAPPVCRDPPPEEPEPPKEETPACPPCPPCPSLAEPEEKPEEPAEGEAPAEPVCEEEEEEPLKFPRAPCPEPLYPPCRNPPAPCQTIVCPQDD
ncbi:hypothetical protein BsWGS_02369 [Bradybaena similaris]